MAKQSKKKDEKKDKKSKPSSYSHSKVSAVDLHTHSVGSLDGVYTIEEIIAIAKKNNVKYLAITDHNSVTEIREFWKRHGFDLKQPIIQVDGVKIIAGVEITCKLGKIPNVDGNPTKIHLLVYGADLSYDSNLSQLLELKRINDLDCDIGLLRDLLRKTGHKEISNQDIREFIRTKRLEDEGFNTLRKEHIKEFLQLHNISVASSNKQLYSLLDDLPNYERLNIEFEDILTLLTGEVAIVAHPTDNIRRTSRKQDFADYLVTHTDGFEKFFPRRDTRLWKYIDQAIIDNHKSHEVYYTGGTDFHDCAHGEVLGKIRKDIIQSSNVSWSLREMDKLNGARKAGELCHKKSRWKASPVLAKEVLNKYKAKAKEIKLNSQPEFPVIPNNSLTSSKFAPTKHEAGENPHHSKGDRGTLLRANTEWWAYKQAQEEKKVEELQKQLKKGSSSSDERISEGGGRDNCSSN